MRKIIERGFRTQFIDPLNSIENNYIEFDTSGAIDFSKSVLIYLSLEPKEEYTEIIPIDLRCELGSSLPHLGNILNSEFGRICKRYPHISDLNPDVQNRFEKVYYKCEKVFHHSHWEWNVFDVEDLTLKQAIKMIKKERLDIVA